jgi:hypothetical protein
VDVFGRYPSRFRTGAAISHLCGYALEILGLRPTLVGISACYLAAGLLAFLGPALHELDKASN